MPLNNVILPFVNGLMPDSFFLPTVFNFLVLLSYSALNFLAVFSTVLMLAPSSLHTLMSLADSAIPVSLACRPTVKSTSYSLPLFDTRVTRKKSHSCKLSA